MKELMTGEETKDFAGGVIGGKKGESPNEDKYEMKKAVKATTDEESNAGHNG